MVSGLEIALIWLERDLIWSATGFVLVSGLESALIWCATGFVMVLRLESALIWSITGFVMVSGLGIVFFLLKDLL